MFFVPFPKGSSCLPNVFHCASWMVRLGPVYYPSFAGDVLVLFLGAINRFLMELPPEVNLNSCFTTDVLEALSQVF